MNKMNDIGNRNPWTGASLPPLPQVAGRDNWVLALEEEGELYHVYYDDDRPLTCPQSAVVEEAIANMVHDVFAVYRWVLERFGGCYDLG